MGKRRTGYCLDCSRNVVHVRAFRRKLFYKFDQLTGSYFEKYGIGPWQCVDCGNRRLKLVPRKGDAPSVREKTEATDPARPVGNFIRTEQSLAHSAVSKTRYTHKFRMNSVEKLLKGNVTCSKMAHELGITELEIQSWIKSYLQFELDKVAGAADPSGIRQPSASGPDSAESLDWGPDETGGPVVDSSVVQRPR